MKKSSTLLAALALVSLPGALLAQDRMQPRQPMADAGMAPPTAVYLMKAGASDLFERQSGQLLSSSRNRAIAGFAREMVRDHTNSTAMVKAAAMRSGLHPKPPMLDGEMRRNLAALRAARGRDRDRLYVMQQKKAHRDALMLQQGYANGGDKPALRNAASKIVPVVKHHMEMLERL